MTRRPHARPSATVRLLSQVTLAGLLLAAAGACGSDRAAPASPGHRADDPAAPAASASAVSPPVATPTPPLASPLASATGTALPSAAPRAPRAAAPSPATPAAPTSIPGIDVSKWQPSIDWRQVSGAGYRFAYVAAVGSYGTNPHFRAQYSGAAAAGLYRGAYFFANPTIGTGTADADRFLTLLGDVHDGRTLWPVLDVERHPTLAACDGISPAAWTTYVRAFLTRVASRAGVTPVIYTAANFWRTCLGNSTAFARTTRLWAAQPRTLSPQPFAGWLRLTFWQHSTGAVPGITAATDRDAFFGTLSDLRALVVPRP